MKIKKKIVLIVVLILAAAGVFVFLRMKKKQGGDEAQSQIKVFLGFIESVISTTGTVYPKNRLEVRPPVGGRIEKILVKEGQDVKTGETLAWMSSTERAALLDAARGQGDEKLKYWQEVYKPVALLAPIDAEVIVATTQPGQTVTTSDAVVVLSDELIVRAQVDETDIGKVRMGQDARISLDAYPDVKIKAKVDHIYYESQTVNNVTIYKVDLVPEQAPEFFRSGMNAAVDFIVARKESTLLLPAEAVHKEGDEDYVLLKQDNDGAPVKRIVKLGISDDKNYEIVSGVAAGDPILIKTKQYVLPQPQTESKNPFLPKFPSGRKSKPVP